MPCRLTPEGPIHPLAIGERANSECAVLVAPALSHLQAFVESHLVLPQVTETLRMYPALGDRPRSLLDELPIRATLPLWQQSPDALPCMSGSRPVIAARPLKNQLQPLHKAARRLGWTVMAVFRDEGVSGTKGRDKRPGLDALLKDDPFPPINVRLCETRRLVTITS